MGKLYPPTIPGTIPAFCTTVDGTSIEVPFSMNRAVGLTEFTGFALKIKKVSGTLVGTVFEDDCANISVEQGAVEFTLPTEIVEKLTQGQFYKVQIAYMNKAQNSESRSIGIYSTIGVVKYTTMPLVAIENMSETSVNNHSYSYTGTYRQATIEKNASGVITNVDWSSKDTTEKLYSSRFVIYDSNNNLIKDSGEILHNTTYDTSAYESSETFMIPEDLELNKIYYLYYIATTVNGMVESSPRYRITQRRQIPMSLEGSITAKLNYDAGLVEIYLKGKKDNQVSSGLFLLSRRADNDPNGWEELYYFSLQSEVPDRLLFTDYTVAQGVKYTYSLQQYNNSNVFSDRMLSNSIVADFEDLFLYDGHQQLKVKFNPKVSTFKPNVVESKTNTLGSKHPFIVRNGDVDYKEFAISGLISYQMDDIELFLSKSDLGLEYTTHNLVTENIKAERDFKLAVLEWLNNGTPKLFRSPTEGNYIVRLMNVTMSPTDTLGRMLHTFSCSAYEIDDYNYANLHKHGLISVINDTKYQMRWATIPLSSINEDTGEVEYFTGQINIGNNYGESTVRPVYHLTVTEMMPGTYFLLGASKNTAQKIYIGTTGAYEVYSEVPYGYVGIPEKDENGNPVKWEGFITYGYKSQVTSLFDLITDVVIDDIPCRRIIGDTGDSLLATLEDIKTTILAIRYVSFSVRGHYPIYVDGNNFNPLNPLTWEFYTDSNNANYYNNTMEYPYGSEMVDVTTPLDRDKLDKWNLYKIYRRREDYSNWTLQNSYGDFNPSGEGYFVSKNGEYFTPFTGYYYDPVTARVIPDDGIFCVNINGEIADLSETEKLYVSGIDNYEILRAGAGIVTDIGYQSQTSTYRFEKIPSSEVYTLKEIYETYRNDYLKKRTTEVASSEEVKGAYQVFINRLTQVVNKYKEENSID